jgi:hypothetical protein
VQVAHYLGHDFRHGCGVAESIAGSIESADTRPIRNCRLDLVPDDRPVQKAGHQNYRGTATAAAAQVNMPATDINQLTRRSIGQQPLVLHYRRCRLAKTDITDANQ